MSNRFLANFLKSILHNIGVLAVGFTVGLLGIKADHLFDLSNFHSTSLLVFGLTLLMAGFLLRVWATYDFYKHQMKVIVLHAQQALITSGPYRYSRHPLYLGGNVFIFYGFALFLGSISALILITLHLPIIEWMARREERQLEARFGDEYREYKKRVRRWI